MATILFAWELGAGFNHLANIRPLAAGLLARGHRVALALRDLSRARLVIPDLRAKLFQSPLSVRGADPASEPCTFAHILEQVGYADSDELGALVEGWLNLFRVIEPDVVVCEHSPTALLTARCFSTRSVIVGTGFFSPVDESPLRNLRTWSRPDWAKLATTESRVLGRINDVLASHDRSPLERITQLYSGADDDFLLTFRELDPYPDRSATRYRGAILNAGGEVPDWPPGEGPRVFCYLKPFPGLPQVFTALRRLDARVLGLLDGFSAQLRQRFVGPRVNFIDKPFDIHRVAVECELAILNGNHGTSVAMLLAGKPTLQIPIYLEQALTMQAIVRQGWGLGASPTGGDPVVERLEQLVSKPDFRMATERFAARYESWNIEEQIDAMLDRIAVLAKSTIR